MHFKDKIVGVAVYLEKFKSRKLAGKLFYDSESQIFEFVYDSKYLYSKNIIPLGPELPLSKKAYRSKQLFESFLDRIPPKENPAYEEYCKSAGIDPKETNPIVLLVSIAKRGPSSFIFEPIYQKPIGKEELVQFRKDLQLTHAEFAKCFDLSEKSLIMIEQGRSSGREIMKRMEIYIRFPEVALFELRRKYGAIHIDKQRIAEKVLKFRQETL